MTKRPIGTDTVAGGAGSPQNPASTAARWGALVRFVTLERRIARAALRHGPVARFAYEFVRFGLKQAWACLFGGLMLALLVATHLYYPADASLARYDFLVLAALAIQTGMLAFRLETWEEAKVILAFHIVGTVMEIFKTAVGSWVYPEPSVLRIAGVPLFSGFMYAAVGSYIARAWRLFDLTFTRHPPLWATGALALAVYINFFTHHYVTDVRIVLFTAAIMLFGPAAVHFRVWRQHRSMPLLAGLGLIAVFIWIAENVATFAKAWVYPHQATGWVPVSVGKLGAWFLLMLISYALVATVHGIRSYATTAGGTGKFRRSTPTAATAPADAARAP